MFRREGIVRDIIYNILRRRPILGAFVRRKVKRLDPRRPLPKEVIRLRRGK